MNEWKLSVHGLAVCQRR